MIIANICPSSRCLSWSIVGERIVCDSAAHTHWWRPLSSRENEQVQLNTWLFEMMHCRINSVLPLGNIKTLHSRERARQAELSRTV